MTTNVAIKNRVGSPVVRLEVTYEGLAAPIDFFADLALIGWRAPTVAPPPHEAIDWSRPNEVTGERFTLRDYTVTGAVVQPPAGTGSRGIWTDAERASNVAALTRVLDRHPTIEVDDPAGLVRPIATLPPPPAPVVAQPTPSNPPAAAAPASSVLAGHGTATLITAPVKPSLAPRVEDALVALGVTTVFDNRERVTTERYRGASYETTVTQLHVAAVVPREQLDTVVSLLEGMGLNLSFAAVADAEVTREPAGTTPGDSNLTRPAPTLLAPIHLAATDPAPDGSTTSVEPEPDRGDAALEPAGLARVVAVADPLCATSINEVISALGLTDAQVTETIRTELLRYRGKQTERQITAIQVEIRVPEPHARLVLTHLAAATHLRLDSDRLWIDLPAPSTEPPGAIEIGAEAEAASSADVTPTRPSPRFGRGALASRMVPPFVSPAR